MNNFFHIDLGSRVFAIIISIIVLLSERYRYDYYVIIHLWAVAA